MADVDANQDAFKDYFPSVPPKTPKAAMSYCRSVSDAPHTALMGVVVDGRQPNRHPVTPRCRIRIQAGSTNRWRLPESLGGDLLGNAQALKAMCRDDNNNDVVSNTTERMPMIVDKPKSALTAKQTADDSALDMSTEGLPPTHRNIKPRTAPQIKCVVPDTPVLFPTGPSTPCDIFRYHSSRSQSRARPDVSLQCLGMTWELHRPVVQQSQALSELLEVADRAESAFQRNASPEMLEQRTSRAGSAKQGQSGTGKRSSKMVTIALDMTDPIVTPHALAMALGNLYHAEVDVPQYEVVAVIAAARVLRFDHLIQGCGLIMQQSITSHTVCGFYKAAVKYKLPETEAACQHWIMLNLVPKLGTEIHLRELPIDLLQKVLRSNRLFTFGEYSVYRMLAMWVYLQLNPQGHNMPQYRVVVHYFSGLSKAEALIDREEGQQYRCLFTALHLHGILDANHVCDIQAMNILPKNWVLKLLTRHYQALHLGGDMPVSDNFHQDAIRQGFMLDDEPHYHTEVVSVHGFHFELKAVLQEALGTYSFFMQRLRPSDPVLSFRQCERYTFSMRAEREVQYSMRIQWLDATNTSHMYYTGELAQKFGVTGKSSRSKVVTLDSLKAPVYITFSLLFPPS